MTGDHDQPYAPTIGQDLAALYAGTTEQAKLRIREALAAELGPLVVLGEPVRLRLRPDPNPFPRIRLWGRR